VNVVGDKIMGSFTKTMPRKITDGVSNVLNFSRWVAAILVVIGHFRHFYFIDYSFVQQKSLAITILYFLSGFDREAVIVFFVLSGYLVGGNVLRQISTGKFKGSNYFLARFSRIYTVLIPALAVVWVLDHLGMVFFNNSAIYTDVYRVGSVTIDLHLAHRLGWHALIGNLLMLDGTTVPAFGTDGPLWSLAYEWWYYMIMLAVAIAAVPSNGWLKRSAGGIAIIAMGALLPQQMLLYGSIWALGAGVAILPRFPRVSVPIGIAGWTFALLFSRFTHSIAGIDQPEGVVDGFLHDFVVGFGYCFFLVAVLQSDTQRVFLSRLNQRFANFSYSMYLTHFPIMVFLGAVLHEMLGERFLAQPTLSRLMVVLMAMVLTCALAFGFGQVTEARTSDVRAFLERVRRRLVPKPAGPKPAERLVSEAGDG
jgi:peptidoglycan/LPS O-acetylase OafA/YrhL